LPRAVRDLMFDTMHGRVGTPAEFAVWNEAAAALRADPMAEIIIAQPERPALVIDPSKPPPASAVTPHVARIRELQRQASEQKAAEHADESEPAPASAA
jgi:hypothetical protein